MREIFFVAGSPWPGRDDLASFARLAWVAKPAEHQLGSPAYLPTTARSLARGTYIPSVIALDEMRSSTVLSLLSFFS